MPFRARPTNYDTKADLLDQSFVELSLQAFYDRIYTDDAMQALRLLHRLWAYVYCTETRVLNDTAITASADSWNSCNIFWHKH